jgi:hypothetical protein
MSGRKRELPTPEVDHPGLARQVCIQETLHQRCERAQLARFREQRLQVGLGREDPVESG